MTSDISLSWSALSDAASYNLQLSSTADFSTTLVNQNSLTDANNSLVGNGGVKYYWRVSINNSLGTSAWSDMWNFTTNPVPANGLVAYYPFNGNANDETGNGHQGVVSGSTLSTDRKGAPNSAYSFNGVDNYISVKDSLQELSLIGDFTVFNEYNSDGCQTPCAVPGYHTIIMKRDVSVGPGDDWPWGLSISYINGGSSNEFKKIYGTRRTNGIADYKWSTRTQLLLIRGSAVVVVQNNVFSQFTLMDCLIVHLLLPSSRLPAPRM